MINMLLEAITVKSETNPAKESTWGLYVSLEPGQENW